MIIEWMYGVYARLQRYFGLSHIDTNSSTEIVISVWKEVIEFDSPITKEIEFESPICLEIEFESPITLEIEFDSEVNNG